MLELNQPYRKNKVNLQDYDYESDIQNRLLLASLTSNELEVLEEVLYGPPNILINRLAQDLNLNMTELQEALEKFAKTGLFAIKGDTIQLNKEKRKYFESQIAKFEESFVPGMEYLQGLLRKVPFHVLLNWYPIPRTSNNIFDSIIEKYLITPQVFQRYLMELNFGNDKITRIVDEVYNSPNLSVAGDYLKEKYEFSDEEFEEALLHLEFNFVCCLTYKKIDGVWKQFVSPFHEWKQYLRFLKESKPMPISNPEKIKKYRNKEFAFIEDMTAILNLSKTKPLPIQLDENENWVPEASSLKLFKKAITDFDKGAEDEFIQYVSRLIQKLVFLRLVKIKDSSLEIHEDADEWLAFSLENRALAAYKLTLSKLDYENFSGEIATERHIREIERSLNQVLHHGWVYFDDFMKGVSATISDDSKISLRKEGKTWKYKLPMYSDEEKRLIKKTILDWLFETGLVLVGRHGEKQCFSVTSFGQSIFS